MCDSNKKSKKDKCDLECDYLILGGGTAGCLIARKLSDIKGISVIVAEAGPDRDHDPLIIDSRNSSRAHSTFPAVYMYNQKTMPNTAANNRIFDYTMGRLSGGGSSINGCLASKGTVQTFTHWKDLAGDIFDPDYVYESYKELENYYGTSLDQSTHGHNGPIYIRQPPNPTQVSIDLSNAVSTVCNVPLLPDGDYNNYKNVNGNGAWGHWEMTQFPDTGLRGSSPFYFLEDVLFNGKGTKGRKLLFLNGTVANKLIYAEGSTTAIGADVIQYGQCRKIYARREVILTMGIHNADFLQRSGVGPADVLAKAGVDLVVSSPLCGTYFAKPQATVANFVTDYQLLGPTDPDLRAVYILGAFIPDPTANSDLNIRAFHLAAIDTQAINPPAPPRTFGISSVFQTPKSIGKVEIQSRDPLQPILPYDNLLLDPADRASIKYMLQHTSVQLGEYMTNLGHYTYNGPTATQLSDENIDNYINTTLDINFHLRMCSCRMNKSRSLGVADGKGRVWGLKNVRVADASAFPDNTDSVPVFQVYLVSWLITKSIIKSLHKCLPPEIKKCKEKCVKKCKERVYIEESSEDSE